MKGKQMKIVQIWNEDTGTEIAHTCRIADNFFTRLKGLQGKTVLPVGEGLLIKPCNSVHTFGMKMNIDVVFLSKENEVLYIMEKMPPRKISPIVKKAAVVLELPAGQLEQTPVLKGQYLTVCPGDT